MTATTAVTATTMALVWGVSACGGSSGSPSTSKPPSARQTALASYFAAERTSLCDLFPLGRFELQFHRPFTVEGIPDWAPDNTSVVCRLTSDNGGRTITVALIPVRAKPLIDRDIANARATGSVTSVAGIGDQAWYYSQKAADGSSAEEAGGNHLWAVIGSQGITVTVSGFGDPAAADRIVARLVLDPHGEAGT